MTNSDLVSLTNRHTRYTVLALTMIRHTDLCIKPTENLSAEHEAEYIQAWRNVDSDVEISIEPTIEGALNLARKIGDRGRGSQTLITGSLYLVGGALSILQPNGKGTTYRTS